MSDTPPYEFLVKLDRWSKKNAALIFAGLPPLENCRDNKIDTSLSEAHARALMLEKLFNSVNFDKKYPEGKQLPISYFREVVAKDMPVPDGLLEAFKVYHAVREPTAAASWLTEFDDIQQKEPLSLYPLVAALVMLYLNQREQPHFNPAKPVNITRITNAILDLLAAHDLSIPGLGKSSLHEKLSDAVKAFQSEYT